MQNYISKTWKRVSALVLPVVLLTGMLACDDIIEEDLEGEPVLLLAPKTGLVTTKLNHQFIWEEVDGAIEYEFQLGTPSFSNLSELLVDSMLGSPKINLSLIPGNYEWRVRAVNGSSQTEYFTRSLEIDSSVILTNQEIVIVGPDVNVISNLSDQDFEWETLLNADQYLFEIRENDFNTGPLYTSAIVTTETSLTLTDLDEGVYQWGVRGENQLTLTPFTVHTLHIDTTAPAVPLLQTPADSASVTDSTIVFSWAIPQDNGSSVQHILDIWNDDQRNSLYQTETLNLGTFTDSLGPGTFYWEVTPMDAAGNYGSTTELRQLIIN